MSIKNATARPWEANNGEITTPREVNRSYRRIAAIQDYGIGGLHEMDEANAELIVRAVNSFDAAKEALQNMLNERLDGDGMVSMDTVEKARAALALMEKVP